MSNKHLLDIDDDAATAKLHEVDELHFGFRHTSRKVVRPRSHNLLCDRLAV